MSQHLNRRDFMKVAALASTSFLPVKTEIKARQAGLQQPNILIVLFDSLSARNMSLYGYSRKTTPHLENLAEKALVYHNHHSPANFTIPSTASLFTGDYSSRHRAYSLWSNIQNKYLLHDLFSRLPANYYTFGYTHNPQVEALISQFFKSIDNWTPIHKLTLASLDDADKYLLQDYNTAIQFTEIGLLNPLYYTTSFLLGRLNRLRYYYIMNRLNHKYADLFPRGVPNFISHFFTLEQAVDWIAQQVINVPQPFFGYIHLLPPHYPYYTRGGFVDRFLDGYHPASKLRSPFWNIQEELLQDQRQMYDETILYCDAEFSRLYHTIKASGALENTVLILTSDHGEMFERGIWAHTTEVLYEPILHIPLLIWKPGNTQREDFRSLTSTVDLLPTLLSLTDMNNSSTASIGELPGHILPGFGRKVDLGRTIFAVEAKENSRFGPLNCATLTAIQWPYKLIEYRGYEEIPDLNELYNLEQDPEELTNLAEQLPQTAANLLTQIHEQLDY